MYLPHAHSRMTLTTPVHIYLPLCLLPMTSHGSSPQVNEPLAISYIYFPLLTLGLCQDFPLCLACPSWISNCHARVSYISLLLKGLPGFPHYSYSFSLPWLCYIGDLMHVSDSLNSLWGRAGYFFYQVPRFPSMKSSATEEVLLRVKPPTTASACCFLTLTLLI